MKAQVASAGTGKTTSLVARILAYVGDGTPLRRIAAVTFTHVAAAQLRDRVREGVTAVVREGAFLEDLYVMDPSRRHRFAEAERELEGLAATTIHGFMIAGLRLIAPAVALRPDFTVLAEWEARALFEEAVATVRFLARDAAEPLHDACDLLGDAGHDLAMELFGMRSLTERFEADADPRCRAAVTLFDAAYGRYLQRLGPDMLGPAEVERKALLMASTAGVRARVVARHPVVLVDEFQDVNPLQGAFFERLEGAGAEIVVVGDPKQSIYGFRHADVEVFRRALRRGERIAPLTRTRRHAQVVTRFLNGLTSALAERSLGFAHDEAPEVRAVGPRAEVRGRVEVHWMAADRPIGELRAQEGRVLAERLHDLHASRGHAYGEMAVLARSYASLRQAEDALVAAGIPCVTLQGRGYYERQEVRDLVHALRVGVEPAGVSLAAWLRGPFGQLRPTEVQRVMSAPDPVAILREHHPDVAGRLEHIRGWVRSSPVEALKALIRDPIVDGRRYVSFLEPRARENVDALLLDVAARQPDDIAVLLERLALLARQADAGDVPQSGEGVQLLTAHRSKGLEWPVVAVFDVGRKPWQPDEPLVLDPATGAVSLPDGPAYAAIRAAKRARDEQELYRLLYVAASRPREVLLFTGSVKTGPRGGPEGWARALTAMGLGPAAGAWDRADFLLQVHTPRGAAPAPVAPTRPVSAADPAPWIDRVFPPHPLPPLQSPSGFRQAVHGVWEGRSSSHAATPTRATVASPPPPVPDGGGGSPEPAEERWPEPLDVDGAERLPPGRAAAVGTLVHYAISHGWRGEDARHAENLARQEVMFPFDEAQRAAILAEVLELLGAYHALLGTQLPTLDERDGDRAELPFAIRIGKTVWQGVIDRLYRVGDTWWIDDYKTDRTIEPGRYHLQAALYRRAVQEVLDVAPRVRLVYLREAMVVPLDDAALDAALAVVPDAA